MRYYSTPAFKITIIPCGYNPEELYPVNKMMAREILKLDPKEFILLQLGRIVPRKGVDNLIHALSKLKSANMNVRLLLVGIEQGVEMFRLQTLARENALEEFVTFTGPENREMLKYYYSAADIFVTTPWYEPFGITPLEAMACGTPVIGAEVGGIKYTVLDGQTGFLVPSRDPDMLAQKIRLLNSKPRLHLKMSNNALERVKSEFTWDKVAAQMDRLYEHILISSRQTSISMFTSPSQPNQNSFLM